MSRNNADMTGSPKRVTLWRRADTDGQGVQYSKERKSLLLPSPSQKQTIGIV